MSAQDACYSPRAPCLPGNLAGRNMFLADGSRIQSVHGHYQRQPHGFSWPYLNGPCLFQQRYAAHGYHRQRPPADPQALFYLASSGGVRFSEGFGPNLYCVQGGFKGAEFCRRMKGSAGEGSELASVFLLDSSALSVERLYVVDGLGSVVDTVDEDVYAGLGLAPEIVCEGKRVGMGGGIHGSRAWRAVWLW